MLSEGTHKVKIIGCFTGQSSEKKTPYYGLELETKDGQMIDFVAYLTEKTVDRNLKTLSEAGYIGKKISSLSDPNLTIEDMFNEVELSAVVEHEEYTKEDGEVKTKAVIKWLNTGSAGPMKFDLAQSVSVFKGLDFDKKLVALNKGKKLEKKEEPEQTQAEFSEDDVPF